jgi:hypothetical protein
MHLRERRGRSTLSSTTKACETATRVATARSIVAVEGFAGIDLAGEAAAGGR